MSNLQILMVNLSFILGACGVATIFASAWVKVIRIDKLEIEIEKIWKEVSRVNIIETKIEAIEKSVTRIEDAITRMAHQ